MDAKKNQEKIVELKDVLLIVPFPNDPIAELREIGKNIHVKSLSKLQYIVNEEALKEISN